MNQVNLRLILYQGYDYSAPGLRLDLYQKYDGTYNSMDLIPSATYINLLFGLVATTSTNLHNVSNQNENKRRITKQQIKLGCSLSLLTIK